MSHDQITEAERVKEIALRTFRAGQRIEATFKSGGELRRLHYRNPKDIPTVLWIKGFKYYLWSVHGVE